MVIAFVYTLHIEYKMYIEYAGTFGSLPEKTCIKYYRLHNISELILVNRCKTIGYIKKVKRHQTILTLRRHYHI